jgi:hypothetical protein
MDRRKGIESLCQANVKDPQPAGWGICGTAAVALVGWTEGSPTFRLGFSQSLPLVDCSHSTVVAVYSALSFFLSRHIIRGIVTHDERGRRERDS